MVLMNPESRLQRETLLWSDSEEPWWEGESKSVYRQRTNSKGPCTIRSRSCNSGPNIWIDLGLLTASWQRGFWKTLNESMWFCHSFHCLIGHQVRTKWSATKLQVLYQSYGFEIHRLTYRNQVAPCASRANPEKRVHWRIISSWDIPTW